MSTNGGSDWSVKNMPNTPITGEFKASSCIGEGTSAVCIVAGQKTSGFSNAPILAASEDGGQNWALKSIANIPTRGIFNAVSCGDAGPNAVCVAAGQNLVNPRPPLLVVSKDAGVTWEVKSTGSYPDGGSFLAASCTGSGASTLCIAAGQDFAGTSLLVLSADGGNSWQNQTIANAPANMTLNTASCTGSGASAICIAGGQDLTGANTPILVTSVDGGASWAVTRCKSSNRGLL